MLEKLQKARGILGFLVELIQHIMDFVKIAEKEDAEDGQKHGAEKKKVVIDLIDTVLEALEENGVDLPIKRETIMNVTDKVIDIAVAFYNAINFFRSKSE